MNSLKKTVLAVFAAGMTFAASSSMASATEAQSTTNLNVRSGPGTNFNVLDTLSAGELVEVTECVSNGWCYVEHEGPNGWVSSTYLAAPADPEPEPVPTPGPSDPECSFGFSIGPDGPSFAVNCGETPAPSPTPTPPPTPISNEVCVYTGNNYSGNEYCSGPATFNALNSTFNNRISSVRLYGDAKVRLCIDNNLGGFCRNVMNDTPVLGGFLNDKVSSMRIYTGAAPAPTPPSGPVTYSTGSINLQQSFQANFDNGNVGPAGADVWYQAQNAIQKFLAPRNGAQFALGDGTNRGYDGCKVASYSSNKISIWHMPVGTYVCVKTNQGRISQFRLNGYTGTTMNLGYTTWAN